MPDSPAEAPNRFPWRSFAWLMAGAGAGVVAIVPTVWPLIERATRDTGLPVVTIVLASFAQSFAIATLATVGGIVAGRATGLGVPPSRPWFVTDAARGPWATVATAAGIGVATAAAIVALDATAFAKEVADLAGSGTPGPAWWAGLASSLYGGIVEELLLRLGLMTVLVRVGMAVTGKRSPGPATVWVSNVLAAVAFGVGHLPATAALAPLTVGLVVRAIALNGGAGVAFGWLFWRRGLGAAMVAHGATDVALHAVLGSLLG